ncbi:hypothetical protein [Enterococcus avium]|uniref:hypothetical protein n=1 Tax=Enterococcus avium TaxID=33945 RepID=UPI001F574BF5|nr:hypothetical protein [Enterococcus avium]
MSQKNSSLDIRNFENKRSSLKNQINFQKHLLLQKNAECSKLTKLNKLYKVELEKRKEFDKEDFPKQIEIFKEIISKFEEENEQLRMKYESLRKLSREQKETIDKMKIENSHSNYDVFKLLQDIEELLKEKDNKILELSNYKEQLIVTKLEEDKPRQQEEQNDEVILDRTIQIKKWIYKHPKIKFLVQILWTNRRRPSTN